MTDMPKVVSINISREKGVSKSPVEEGFLRKDLGVEGDAHAGPGNRQVSLLALEAIDSFNRGVSAGTEKVKPGDFGENLTISGMRPDLLKPGIKLKVGDALIEISLIGKKCLKPCAIYRKFKSCIMSTQGVFARVKRDGKIRRGDEIQEEK